ncbi:MAG: ABC transporter transmembrane domain-containing protein [Pseudomonadota bacterium]
MALPATTRLLLDRFYRGWVHQWWRRLILVVALMVVVAATTGTYPLIINYAFELMTAQDPRVVWLLPPLVLAVTALKGGALYAQVVTTQQLVLHVVTALRRDMFAHLVAADVARVLGEPTGSLVSRFQTDIGLIMNSLTRAATNLIRDLFTVIALLAAMLYLDWALSLVVLVIYPIAILPIVRLGERLRRVAHSVQAQAGELTAFLHEGLAGIRMVKAYRLEDYQRRRADAAFAEMADLQLRSTKARAGVDPLLEVLGGLAVGGVLAVGGWRIANGDSTVGEFTGFISALLMAAQPVRGLGTLNVVLQEGISALQRVFALLDERPNVVDRPGAAPLKLERGEVRLEGVHFTYPSGEGQAVAGIDMILPAGRTTALVGPSGAGKTTVLNLIPRFFDVSAGRVTIDGQDVRDVSLASLRDAVALVSQEVVLFDDSIGANIAFGRSGAADDAVRDAAAAAAVDRFVGSLEQGFATPVGDRGERLSGGQRQRVALARAILRDAPILLLDEATSALDAESERQVQAALDRLRRGRTTLVIAHRLSTVRGADQIVVLDGGRIVETGTHDTLLSADRLYAKLCRMQLVGDTP